jgi:hypothetical protein
MKPAVDPHPPDARDGLVQFHVDPQAPPGNAAPALAALLIGLDRTRRQRERAQAEGAADQASGTDQDPQPQPQD